MQKTAEKERGPQPSAQLPQIPWNGYPDSYIFGLYSIVELSSKSNQPRNNVAFKLLYFRSVPSDFY